MLVRNSGTGIPYFKVVDVILSENVNITQRPRSRMAPIRSTYASSEHFHNASNPRRVAPPREKTRESLVSSMWKSMLQLASARCRAANRVPVVGAMSVAMARASAPVFRRPAAGALRAPSRRMQLSSNFPQTIL